MDFMWTVSLSNGTVIQHYPMVYSNWYSSQPSADYAHMCVAMYFQASYANRWFVYPCSSAYYYLCEIP